VLLTSKSIGQLRLFTPSPVDGAIIACSFLALPNGQHRLDGTPPPARYPAPLFAFSGMLMWDRKPCEDGGRSSLPHGCVRPEFQAMRATATAGRTKVGQISARSNGDLRVRRAQDLFGIRNRCLWLDPCRPYCSRHPGNSQPGPSALPVAVLAVPLAGRRQ
jgi:hypothetical protein